MEQSLHVPLQETRVVGKIVDGAEEKRGCVQVRVGQLWTDSKRLAMKSEIAWETERSTLLDGWLTA